MGNDPAAIRTATPDDYLALLDMQARSLRQLGRDLYTPREIETFLDRVGTMDPVLLGDGTYFVIEAEGRIAACGGWSLRRPGYAKQAGAAAAPAPRVPVVRSIFTDPDFTRQGLGRRIMTHLEAELTGFGFDAATLVATLSGVPFYRAIGYEPVEPKILDLGAGVRFVGLGMTKRLQAARRRAA